MLPNSTPFYFRNTNLFRGENKLINVKNTKLYNMRGLTTFIADIRKCRSKEDEGRRINKELANIRSKFNGRKLLNGYDKKKYICKLIYIFFLGRKSDLGYMVAVNLLSSNAYTEKQIGYLFISVIMDEENKFTPLIINALKDDLSSYNQSFQNLALQFISNNASKAISDTLSSQVFEILTSTNSLPFVKQTAALTLLQLLRLTPGLISTKQFANYIVHLLSHQNLGLVTASASLVEWLASQLPAQSACVKQSIVVLHRLVSSSPLDCSAYAYYDMPAPWLMVKLLRILQKFPVPHDMSLRCRFKESLELILSKAISPHKVKNFDSHNARYSVIFEAICTIIAADIDQALLSSALKILGATLQHTEPNFRFITLDIMTQLSSRKELKETINMYWESILGALRSERDISIRKRAVDLLYAVCDENNVQEISVEMIHFIKEQNSVREEVTLKLVTLAERFRENSTWYIETLFEVLLACGNGVDTTFWHSMVKFVASNDAIQQCAAKTAFVYLQVEPCPDIVAKVAGYVLGEFGHTLSTYPEYDQVKQLDRLQAIYRKCSRPTRALLLSTYMKFIINYPELKGRIQSIFREECNIGSEDVEIQQRSVEYLVLSEKVSRLALVASTDQMSSYQSGGYPSLNTLELPKYVGRYGMDSKTALVVLVDEKPPYPSQDYLSLNTVDLPKFEGNNGMVSKPALVAAVDENPSHPPRGYLSLNTVELTKSEENKESASKSALVDIRNEIPYPPRGYPSLSIVEPPKPEGKTERVSPKTKTSFMCLENSERDSHGRDSTAKVSNNSTYFGLPQSAEPPDQNILIDISDEAPISRSGLSSTILSPQATKLSQVPQNTPAPYNQKLIQNLIFQNSGTLYDDEVIRILLRREFDKHYGTLYLVYTNKSQLSLENFGVQGNFADLHEKCRIWFKPECLEIRAGQNFLQNIHLECLSEFVAKPSLTLKYQQAGQSREVKVSLPLTMNMFIEPVIMSPLTFLTRWNNLDQPNQEVKKSFSAKFPMLSDIATAKLRGFRLGVTKNVSEIVENVHCAGLFHTRSGKVGFLLILACNSEKNTYELTIRSKLRSLSLCVCNLICELF